MSDTRNHTTRDQLAETIRVECFYGGLDEDRAEYARMADALLASDAIAAVRAAAVAETTAAIEAVLRDKEREAQPLSQSVNPVAAGEASGIHMTTHAVRAALSGGRTALDTTLAQARRQALLDAADHLDGTCTEMECGSPAHWAAAALRHRANEGSNQ